MSGNIHVNYGNVQTALSAIRRHIHDGGNGSSDAAIRARSYMEQMGGEGNAAALESLQALQGSEGLIAAAVGQLMQAVGNSAQKVQSEEGVIASTFTS